MAESECSVDGRTHVLDLHCGTCGQRVLKAEFASPFPVEHLTAVGFVLSQLRAQGMAPMCGRRCSGSPISLN